MRNEIADSHSAALQCMFSNHLTRLPLLVRFKHKGTGLPTRSKYNVKEYVCSLRDKTREHSAAIMYNNKDEQLLLRPCILLVSPAQQKLEHI